MLARIILLAIVFYLLYRVVRFFQSIGEKNPKRHSNSVSPPKKMMVKDEVCNTYLPEDEAIKEIIDGQVHYFCSEECRKKFKHLKAHKS
ncbi:MAG: hypothetical protein ACPLZD_01615 [Candidatus Saccharicenans sp.]|nr:MAG: hypothetical protein C0168_10810 [Candidatus Aminicenantes bacterium]HEK86736.1 hypothetical protein [Candidatus Aminicenantes bacterium]